MRCGVIFLWHSCLSVWYLLNSLWPVQLFRTDVYWCDVCALQVVSDRWDNCLLVWQWWRTVVYGYDIFVVDADQEASGHVCLALRVDRPTALRVNKLCLKRPDKLSELFSGTCFTLQGGHRQTGFPVIASRTCLCCDQSNNISGNSFQC